ncbi:uncharacterized protein LJ206_010676 isoform 1-T1 [Theristicus caerulescens]
MLETLGFISAASARKPGSAQAQCSPPQSRTEEGGSGAQHLRSGYRRDQRKKEEKGYLPYFFPLFIQENNLNFLVTAYLEIFKSELLRTLSCSGNEICFEHVKYQTYQGKLLQVPSPEAGLFCVWKPKRYILETQLKNVCTMVF